MCQIKPQINQSTMASILSPAKLQEERSKMNRIPHQQLAYTYCEGESVIFGCGDVGILHNIAIFFKNSDFDEKFQDTINRFHIIVRTMRRSPHWDWVKPTHINTILTVMDEIVNSDIDVIVGAFKEWQQFFMEHMEKSVEQGVMAEGDYIDLANGLKDPYEFITGSDFKRWVKGRSDFYKTLNGEMPKIKLIQIPRLNEHDGKAILITA